MMPNVYLLLYCILDLTPYQVHDATSQDVINTSLFLYFATYHDEILLRITTCGGCIIAPFQLIVIPMLSNIPLQTFP